MKVHFNMNRFLKPLAVVTIVFIIFHEEVINLLIVPKSAKMYLMSYLCFKLDNWLMVITFAYSADLEEAQQTCFITKRQPLDSQLLSFISSFYSFQTYVIHFLTFPNSYSSISTSKVAQKFSDTEFCHEWQQQNLVLHRIFGSYSPVRFWKKNPFVVPFGRTKLNGKLMVFLFNFSTFSPGIWILLFILFLLHIDWQKNE